MLQPGAEIAGYRIEGTLGRGGMGRVYEATQLALERTVALKILNDDLGTDEAFRARFRREGRVQGALAHPHIVGVLEAGEADGHLFIAMQMVRGPTLKELLIKEDIDQWRAVEVLAQIADALDTAHAAGLTHRDIKPQNVLVGPGDHGYLADFGLTKTLSDSAGFTRTGQFMGTIDYISPEQISGHSATPASDIYALAAVLYECLTGSVPFPRDSEAAVLFAHLSSEPPPIGDACPELPAELDAVVARGMAKDPADRPATAVAMLDAARSALGTLDPPARGERDARPGSGDGARARVLRRSSVDDTFPPTMEPGSRLVPPESDPSLTVPDHLPPDLVDNPPPVAPDEEPVPARAVSRRAAAAAALGAIAVATVAGVAIGSSGGGAGDGPQPLTGSAANGTVALSFPATWHQQAAGPAARALGLSDTIALANDARTGAVHVGTTDATTPELLTTSALKALGGRPPTPQRVRIGALSAYRYPDLRLRGVPGSTTVLTAPTTVGTVTFSCTTSDGATASVKADCTRIARSVRLQRGRPATLGPDAAYATAVGRTLVTLDGGRASARSALADATGPKSSAAAAKGAATAYATAAVSLAKAKPGPAERPIQRRLRRALAAAEAGYKRLASAARAEDRSRYARAAKAITGAEKDVRAQLDELKALGYRVG